MVKPAPPAFGTGKPSPNLSILSIWGFSAADKSFVLGHLLKVVHGVKVMLILIETSQGLGIKDRWGPLPISMVLHTLPRAGVRNDNIHHLQPLTSN